MSKQNPSYLLAYQSTKTYISFLFVSVFIASTFTLTSNVVSAGNHSQLPTTPCDIRLVFSTDKLGMPSVTYKLGLQIRNRMAQNITGVSVYWLDDNSSIIGNSDAICGANSIGISPSEAGHCGKIVQEFGATLLQKLGEATWTQIINNELDDFEKVKQCAIIGFSYNKQKPKTY